MDNVVKKCIVEETESYTIIHHTFDKIPECLKNKIDNISGVETTAYRKYQLLLYTAKCFDKEKIIDTIMKTILCYKI